MSDNSLSLDIHDDQPAGGGRMWVHCAFATAYILLLLRLLPPLFQIPDTAWQTVVLKLSCSIIAGHVWDRYPFDEHYPTLVANVVEALITYGSIHYATTARLPHDRSDSRMINFLYFCRSILYLFVTLLVLLIIVRMCVLIYQDVSTPRMTIIRGVGSPGR